jgi:RimJ/RimL family protein N-acetyltransferase
VTLRRPRPEDFEARVRLGTDAGIFRMYGGSLNDLRPMTEEAARRWVQRLLDLDYAWVIEVGTLIGQIRLDGVDLTDRRASLAIGIEDSARLGIGLGTEAIALVSEHSFNVLKLHRLSVRVLDYNARAIRAYEKCGFVVEGREREAAFVDGIWHDDVMMGLLDREYAGLQRTVSLGAV